MPKKGCEYGRMNRQMIGEIGTRLDKIEKRLEGMENKMQEMFNEMYHTIIGRYSPNALKIISLLTGVIGAGVGAVIIAVINMIK